MIPKIKHFSFENTITKIDEFIHMQSLSCVILLEVCGSAVSTNEKPMQDNMPFRCYLASSLKHEVTLFFVQ